MAAHRERAAALALAMAVASCGPARTAAAPTAQPSTDAPPLGDADVRRVLDEVAVARQLPQDRPIVTHRVDRKTFVRLIREGMEQDAEEPGLSRSAAFLVGFNLVPPPEQRRGLASAAEVLEEEIAGFYDAHKDAIFVPLVPIRSDKDALEQRAVLAHEAEHALQHRHFPALEHAGDQDVDLARLALFEGDAMMAMAAYLGTEQGEPVGRTLRRVTDATRGVSLDHLTNERRRRAIDRAAPILRRELEFPYVEGMLFASDLYRAGGFPLVNDAFRSPPTSTMQVLHPDKYLAGIEPRPFSEVTMPRGLTRADSGTMGELRTRLLLSHCMDPSRAERAADGWAGDRYSVFVDHDRTLSFGWVTAWQTSDDADAFERAAHDANGCFAANRLGEREDYSIGTALRVTRRDRLVAVVRNLDNPSAASLEQALFASAGREPEAKPRSTARIPPRTVLPPPRPGVLEGDAYRNDWVGIVGRTPAGMQTTTSTDGLDLVIGRPGVVVHGALAISTRLANRDENEKSMQSALTAFREALSKEGIEVPLFVRSNGRTRTALGDGIERTWGAGDTPLELRMVLVPICAGTGSIVFVQIYADPYARYVLDGWLNSFQFVSGRNVEACSYLDPK